MRRRRLGLAAVAAVVALATVAACAEGKPVPRPSVTSQAPAPPSTPATRETPETSTTPSVPTTATPTAGPVTAAPTPALQRFYSQHVAWASCGPVVPRAQCAAITVPLDYADLARGTITLRINRIPATGPGSKLGALVVNPGGPGGSGLQYALAAPQIISANVRARYDVVGFDPRGVGQSTPVQCLGTAALDAIVNVDPAPRTAAGISRVDAAGRAIADGCAARSARLLPYLGTDETDRDLDVIRALVGDRKLTYLGKSYGTYIGSTYAQLFPSRVGRFVLDGAVDPALDPDESNLSQLGGFQTELTAFLAACVASGTCPLGTSVAAAESKLGSLLAAVRSHPVPTGQGGQGTPLTIGEAYNALLWPLYSTQRWPSLEAALALLVRGDGGGMQFLSDEAAGRGPTGYDNSLVAFWATSCLDNPYGDTDAQIRALLPRFAAVSPLLGPVFAWESVPCRYWHVKPKPDTGPIHAPGAPPILVIATTRDPATPYAEGKALAAQLDSGVFLGRVGDGHTAYLMGNPCIDAKVNAFFLTGALPVSGTVCPDPAASGSGSAGSGGST